MNLLTDADIPAVISLAKERGFKGWGGHCASAALSINRQIFNGKGQYVVSCNRALLSKGCLVGHVAVQFEGYFYDADGEPKDFEDIESWGMLDEHTVDFTMYFDEADPWNEEKALDVAMFTIQEDVVTDSLVMNFDMSHLEINVTSMEDAIDEFQRNKSEDNQLDGWASTFNYGSARMRF
ncbi:MULTISPECIES: hypothetical protein [Aeromonas]|uniref:hypothetical protein n=1 Tax=Aeromonas TaxID=642 RepID=UPI002B052266|nr:hypothetical protein [Aeromonas jandaei]